MREAGVQHDVHQAALSLARHGRNAVDALPLLPVRGDEVERAGLLGDQHPAVRQERHRPGRFEVGHHLYLERQVRRLLGRAWSLARGVHGTAGNQRHENGDCKDRSHHHLSGFSFTNDSRRYFFTVKSTVALVRSHAM